MWHPRLARRPTRSGSGRAANARLDPPLYARIVDALAADIAQGQLVPGARLPTQRELAEAVGTTVATVTRSYTEARRRGLVDATVGRGTFVREAIYAPSTRGPVDLTVNSLAAAPFVGAMLASLSACVDGAAGESLLAYQPHQGSLRHREAGVAWLRSRGVDADPADVVVTAGAQHAMLVALATLTRPRDVVLVERLTYPGVKSLANHLHLRLEPVDIDEEGMTPDSLASAAARTRAKVIYAMPTFQNPTASTMSAGRRRAIAEVVTAQSLTIIEDDQYGFLADDTPLAALLPDRCVHISSLSKSLAAGLRVGFLRAPAALVQRLAAAVFASAVMAPPVTAELAARWIADGTARRIVDWKREELTARQQIARRLLGWRASRAASPHVWLAMPPQTTAEDFVEQARLRGVLVSASPAFGVGPARPDHAVRICLGPPASRDALEHALRILAGVLKDPPRPHAGIV
jgi:DNA-binding transcriptional MocR family regulator